MHPTNSESGQNACTKCFAGRYSTLDALDLAASSGNRSTTTMNSMNTMNTLNTNSVGNLHILQLQQNNDGVSQQQGPEICLQCRPGQYGAQERVVADHCVDCLSGTFSPVESSVCSDCASGTYSTVALAVCLFCPSGYSSIAGQPRCIGCLDGTFSDVGYDKCTDCPTGTFKHYNALSGGRDSFCDACPQGWSTNNQTKLGQCLPCVSGKYSFYTRQAMCDLCGPGQSTNDKTGEFQCTLCDKGKFAALTGQEKCATCEGGRYSYSVGFVSCESCESGTFSVSGSASCQACPQGWDTQYSEGSRSCIPCEAGKFGESALGGNNLLDQANNPYFYEKVGHLYGYTRVELLKPPRVETVGPNTGQLIFDGACKGCNLDATIYDAAKQLSNVKAMLGYREVNQNFGMCRSCGRNAYSGVVANNVTVNRFFNAMNLRHLALMHTLTTPLDKDTEEQRHAKAITYLQFIIAGDKKPNIVNPSYQVPVNANASTSTTATTTTNNMDSRWVTRQWCEPKPKFVLDAVLDLSATSTQTYATTDLVCVENSCMRPVYVPADDRTLIDSCEFHRLLLVIGHGQQVCHDCSPGTWTKDSVGASQCSSCTVGEVSSHGGGCQTCASAPLVDMDDGMIIDPATSHSTNRGEFSYFAGDREACTMCPLGTECTGGDGVQTSWGWWMSEGLHSEKSKLIRDTGKNEMKHKATSCPWMNVNDQDEVGEVGDTGDTGDTGETNKGDGGGEGGEENDPFRPKCGQRCADPNEPGCVCKYTKHAQCNDVLGAPQTPYQTCVPNQTVFPTCPAAEIVTAIKRQAIDKNFTDSCSNRATDQRCGGRSWADGKKCMPWDMSHRPMY
jgi:hypothetical protein